MHAEYQLQDKGMVISRYLSNRSNSEVAYPSLTIMEKKSKKYIWYISNSVFAPVVANNTYHFWSQASDDKALSYVMAHTDITLSSYTCMLSESTLSLYSGLQPCYWISWRAQPHTVIICNTTWKGLFLQLDSLYATMVLTRSICGHVSFTMTITRSFKQLPHCQYDIADCVDFQTQAGLQYISVLPHKGVVLQITSFEHTGPTPTTRPAIMANTGASPSMYNDTRDRTWDQVTLTEGIVF